MLGCRVLLGAVGRIGFRGLEVLRPEKDPDFDDGHFAQNPPNSFLNPG